MTNRQAVIDAIYNYGSFGLLAVSAVAANILVVYGWGSSALGAFNQVVAVFIVAAQVAVLGQQNAMLQKAAALRADANAWTSALAASAAIALLASTTVALTIWLLSEHIGTALASPSVAIGLQYIAFAFPANALVKVAMQTCNGLGLVREYAVLQGVRPAAIILILVVLKVIGSSADKLPFAIVLAELITAAVALRILAPKCTSYDWSVDTKFQIRELTYFGLKSWPGGLLSELNTRVDYFILGLYASDDIVGSYSFAASLAEGFFMALVVLRVLATPDLSRALRSQQDAEVRRVGRHWKRTSLLVAAILFSISVAGLHLISHLGILPSGLDDVPNQYLILAIGVLLASPYVPLGNVMLLQNRPTLHSLYFIGLVACNLIGNILLTPLYGAYGTSVSTMLAYALSGIWLAFIWRRQLGLPS